MVNFGRPLEAIANAAKKVSSIQEQDVLIGSYATAAALGATASAIGGVVYDKPLLYVTTAAFAVVGTVGTRYLYRTIHPQENPPQ